MAEVKQNQGVPSAWLRALVLPLIVLAWLALLVLLVWVLGHFTRTILMVVHGLLAVTTLALVLFTALGVGGRLPAL